MTMYDDRMTMYDNCMTTYDYRTTLTLNRPAKRGI